MREKCDGRNREPLVLVQEMESLTKRRSHNTFTLLSYTLEKLTPCKMYGILLDKI